MSATTVFRAETLDSLRRQLGDAGVDLVAELIALYLVQGRDLVGQIEAAGAAPDPIRLRAAAHKLKGSTATLGGDRLAAVCQRIEVAPSADLDADNNLNTVTQEVRREFEHLATELARYRSALLAKPTSPEAV